METKSERPDPIPLAKFYKMNLNALEKTIIDSFASPLFRYNLENWDRLLDLFRWFKLEIEGSIEIFEGVCF